MGQKLKKWDRNWENGTIIENFGTKIEKMGQKLRKWDKDWENGTKTEIFLTKIEKMGQKLRKWDKNWENLGQKLKNGTKTEKNWDNTVSDKQPKPQLSPKKTTQKRKK